MPHCAVKAAAQSQTFDQVTKLVYSSFLPSLGPKLNM